MQSAPKSVLLPLLLLVTVFLTSCIASRSAVEGLFDRPTQANLNANPVSVLFVFRHEAQLKGFDAIPKLQPTAVKDFDSLFGDALREIHNIAEYETFTIKANDVNDPARREAMASARATKDYVVEIDLAEESSFRQQCFSGLISTLSLTLVPMPYDWNYTFRARVFAKDGKQVAALERKSTLTSWMEMFLIFAYPFYPFEGKREELYSESLHDIFRQIETEKILK